MSVHVSLPQQWVASGVSVVKLETLNFSEWLWSLKNCQQNKEEANVDESRVYLSVNAPGLWFFNHMLGELPKCWGKKRKKKTGEGGWHKKSPPLLMVQSCNQAPFNLNPLNTSAIFNVRLLHTFIRVVILYKRLWLKKEIEKRNETVYYSARWLQWCAMSLLYWLFSFIWIIITLLRLLLGWLDNCRGNI